MIPTLLPSGTIARLGLRTADLRNPKRTGASPGRNLTLSHCPEHEGSLLYSKRNLKQSEEMGMNLAFTSSYL